jgi:hypothetical protein
MQVLVDKPKEPFPLYREKEGAYEKALTESGNELWTCGECGTIHSYYNSQTEANKCCLQPHCACGEKIPKYWSECTNCQNRKIEARRIAESVEINECSGTVYSDTADRYWSDLDEFEDWMANAEMEDIPEWLYTCKIKKFGKLYASNVIEHELCEHHDGAECNDLDGLQKLLDVWVTKQTLESYFPDYSKRISVTKIFTNKRGSTEEN